MTLDKLFAHLCGLALGLFVGLAFVPSWPWPLVCAGVGWLLAYGDEIYWDRRP